MKAYYTPLQVAQILNVTRRSVYSYISSGQLKSYTFRGRLHRISEEDLCQFIEAGLEHKDKHTESDPE